MPPTKAPQKRVVFDSDDSSASDGEGHAHGGGDALAREMAAAVERERRKNPHAETGRAKLPRAHPLASSSSSAATTTTAAASTAAPYKAKKTDLFSSSSGSSSDDEEEEAKSPIADAKKATHSSAAVPVKSSSGKVAHVNGLSFRAVKRGGGGEEEADAPARTPLDDGDAEEGEGEDDNANVLRINKAFATRYEEQKRKQELHTLAEKYRGKLGRAAAIGFDGDDDDNESEEDDEEDDAEEDEDAVLLTRENSLSFAKALLAVRKATVPLRTTAADKKDGSGGDADAAAAAAAEKSVPALLPKEVLLKDRFFPPAEEQIQANTTIFEKYVERKRNGDGDAHRFTLSDEYARALKATADSEDAVVTAAEGGERDGLRKLRPQNAEEAKLRAAFLRDVQDSADTFEVVRGTKSNKTGANSNDEDDDDEETLSREQQAAREEERRLLEEAFSLGGAGVASTKSVATAEDGEEGGEGVAQRDNGGDEFLRDFFIQELWRPGTTAKKSKKGKKKSLLTATAADGEAGENNHNDDDDDDEGEDDGNGGSYYDRLAQLAREEEDEAFFNDAEVWEREYQEKKYRHQEAEEAEATGGADAAHVQTFPRPIGEAAVGLLRKPDTARKDARQRRRERAEAAHAQQVEELKRLKHLKRREIEDQRALIASVAGLTVGKRHGGEAAERGAFADGDAEEEAELSRLKAVWSDKDLDAPFDPAEFDKKMAQLFNEDYYDEKNVDEDEVAYFDEELDKEDEGDDGDDDGVKSGAAPALFAAASLEDAQALRPTARKSAKKNKEKAKAEGGSGGAEKFFDDDAFGPQQGDGGDALSLLYPSEALQALEKERQQLSDLLLVSSQKGGGGDGANGGESNAELLERLQASLKKKEEEYYQLHRDAAAESAGGGNIAFRYREVEPEDFTLSVEEILALDDRQLNMIAPMNCYAAYLDKDSNERDRRRIERRRQKGFREVGSDRTSRRYGDVRSTAVLDPAQMNEEEGAAIAEKLSKRLREEGEDPEAPLAPASARPHHGGPPKVSRGEGFRGRGRGGGGERGAGFSRGRGRGGAAPSPSFRGRGGAGGFAGSAHRGGRGGPRGGRGGFRGGH